MMLYHFIDTQFLVNLLRRNRYQTSPKEVSSDDEGNPVCYFEFDKQCLSNCHIPYRIASSV